MTPTDRRAIRVGAAAIGIALFVRITVATAHAEQALWQRIQLKALRHAGLVAELQSLDSLEKQAPEVRSAMIAMAPRLLSGESPADAVADLAARARSLIDSEGGQPERTTVTADSLQLNALKRVALEIEFLSDTPGLLAILSKLGRGTPVMSVARVRVASAGSASAPAESLRVSLVLTGWYLGRDSTP